MAPATSTRKKKREVNLDTLAAQRREADGVAPTIKFRGKVFTMPLELPFVVVEAVGALNELEAEERNKQSIAMMADVTRALLGDSHDDFMKLGPSTQDVTDLIKAVFELYGTSEGESSASGTS